MVEKDTLLKQFEKNLKKEDQVDLLELENLLILPEFKEYQLDLAFLAEFTEIIKRKNLPPLVANKIYYSINLVELQTRYGKQSYRELDIALKAKAKYWDSMMQKNNKGVIEKTLGKALVIVFVLFAALIILGRILLVASMF